MKKLRCRLGLHGADAGRSRRQPAYAYVWCVECGTTWEITDDGLSRKRLDLRFGSALPGPEEES